MKKKWILSKLKLATGSLNTKNRNELTVLDQKKVRFCLESTDCALPVMIAGTYAMTTYLAQTFFSTLNYDNRTFVV